MTDKKVQPEGVKLPYQVRGKIRPRHYSIRTGRCMSIELDGLSVILTSGLRAPGVAKVGAGGTAQAVSAASMGTAEMSL